MKKVQVIEKVTPKESLLENVNIRCSCIVLLWTRSAHRKWSAPLPGSGTHADPTPGTQRSHSPESQARWVLFLALPSFATCPVTVPSYLNFVFQIGPMQVLAYVTAKISSSFMCPWQSYILNNTDPRERWPPIG